jgi:hypothetical protein
MPREIVVGTYCECGHPKSDHDGGDCAYGWSGEPDEAEACSCQQFVYAGDDVVLVR